MTERYVIKVIGKDGKEISRVVESDDGYVYETVDDMIEWLDVGGKIVIERLA